VKVPVPELQSKTAESSVIFQTQGEIWNWPCLSADAHRRVASAEAAAQQQLATEIRAFTPGNPDWLRNRNDILEGGYRAIDFICAYAEAVFDAHAQEYQRLHSDNTDGIYSQRIVPLVRQLSWKAWGAWLLATSIVRPPEFGAGTAGKEIARFPLPPRIMRETGASMGELKLADVPPDSQLLAGLMQLQERYDEHLRRVLGHRASFWQRRSQPEAEDSARGDDDVHARVNAFLTSVLAETGRTITRKDIWKVAGYTEATQFERFQRKKNVSRRSAIRFNQILELSPATFMERLDSLNKTT
jgi:hypothetical protein